MPKPPTVYDVAAQAGVSIATVSRVIRDPDTVKAATRDRVNAAIEQLGYVPSASARGLAARRTNVIGLFFPRHDDVEPPALAEQTEVSVITGDDEQPENENLYYDEVLRGAELEASRRGFALMIASGTGGELERLVTDLAGRVDGLAVLAGTVPMEMLERVARHIPVVLLGGDGRQDRFDHVHSNNGPGMKKLAEHLLERGAKSFAYVRGPEGVADDDERFGGFSQAVGDRPVEVVRGDFTRRGGRAAARALTSTPDAIVCANDQTALGVLDVITPHEGKPLVTGFDGIAAGRHSSPSLTTVHQPMSELGRAAIDVVTTRLEHPDAPRQTRTLPVRVILRESAP
ncbi:LacI family DNA-binding transcriptional regulator [Protaetiibacter sp. WY-16]|uniref:LacI family DNA-binding transcriptional regulator n=1 Tax=Antiquaquibacter soli TaxID=3064523 RepID=A0ABT9BPV1_9MICO|nr:LacI family DNA-binding transcriptional regulator [Protaetiibacter sp. WY-16]